MVPWGEVVDNCARRSRQSRCWFGCASVQQELHHPPLRSAEPDPATDSQRSELTLSPEHPAGGMSRWITDLTAAHRAFVEKLADRQSMTVPAEDPTYGDLGQAFPLWPGPGGDAILQPPKPEIRPSPYVLERAADRDADWEAGD
jgi:hypothetical protein